MSFMRLSLKKKIILLFLAAMLGTVAFFATYFYNSTRKLMSQSEKNLETIITKSIAQEIQDNLDYTESNVKSVVENPKVQELFAKRDREGLYKYLLPNYESVKDRFPQAHFHLPDSTSFLRMNKPKKFGDSLKDFRFTVNEANSSKKTVKAIESGVSGFGFRVVMPVSYNGEHVGSFEFGRELEHSFLETLKNSYDGDFALYQLDDKGSVFVSSTASDKEVEFPFPEKLDKIKNGESFL
jgi:methyl-accepting chemotaxis sensory transducer